MGFTIVVHCQKFFSTPLLSLYCLSFIQIIIVHILYCIQNAWGMYFLNSWNRCTTHDNKCFRTTLYNWCQNFIMTFFVWRLYSQSVPLGSTRLSCFSCNRIFYHSSMLSGMWWFHCCKFVAGINERYISTSSVYIMASFRWLLLIRLRNSCSLGLSSTPTKSLSLCPDTIFWFQ